MRVDFVVCVSQYTLYHLASDIWLEVCHSEVDSVLGVLELQVPLLDFLFRDGLAAVLYMVVHQAVGQLIGVVKPFAM